jgi:hypothetical protein
VGFERILSELDWPAIYLVKPGQFKRISGWDIGDNAGGSYGNVITVHPGMRGKARENTLYHEIGHCLWPYKPEWWITCFGLKMARGGGVGSAEYLRGHMLDELPTRSVLLRMAQRQARKLRDR